MSVTVEGDVVRLSGDGRVEDAEALCAALTAAPGRRVDVSGLRRAHTAVIQALLALKPPVTGAPDDPFLREHVFGQGTRPLP